MTKPAALTPAVFHILLALSGSERHGYGILKTVLEHTDGQVRLGPGTLYGTLQRLMDAEWVEESTRRAAMEDERRRFYKLTRVGRQALDAEVERMERLVLKARGRSLSAKLPKLSSR